MKNQIICFILCLSVIFSLNAQNVRSYYDGPYIEIKEDCYKVEWIEKGRYRKAKFELDSDSFFLKEGLPPVKLSQLEFKRDTSFEFNNVKKFAALSDVHGQYDLMISLLQAHKVIDSLSNWSYGEGHLVVLGDIFDRGDKVTECLWFLFNLEKQAEKAGGKCHFLLGNHELMVLHGDKTYVNTKYIYTAGKSRKSYHEFFEENMVLGAWLRSKNITVSINGSVFVHGGFSKKVLERESSLSALNNLFRNKILPNADIAKTGNDFLKELYFENGPLWYRGYAEPQNFDIAQAEFVLNTLNKESVIIGHTSMPQIYSLFANRVILIDSSIKFGKTGELLISERDLFYRGKLNGEKVLLRSDASNSSNNSIFEYLNSVVGNDLHLDLDVAFDTVLAQKINEEYLDAIIRISENGNSLYSLEGRIRTRGNMRKKLCEWPPLKIDFKKKELRQNGFRGFDKLKLALPCLSDESKRNYLFKEYHVYKLYEAIEPRALQSRLVNLSFSVSDSLIHSPAILLEDEDNFANRINAEILENANYGSDAMDRKSYLKMVLFQYMIANNDWDVYRHHNIYITRKEGIKELVPIAYDFDYAGIVNQEYQMPENAFPRMDMTHQKLRLKHITEDEIHEIQVFFNQHEENWLELCKSASYLSSEERKFYIAVIKEFIDNINSKKEDNPLVKLLQSNNK